MKKTFGAAIIGLALFNSSFVVAQTKNKEQVIPPEIYDVVVKNGSYKFVHPTGDEKLTLLPNCDFKSECESNRIIKSGEKFPFLTEMIYLVKKSDLINKRGENVEADISDISKIFRSVSKMKGMTYFSTTRKKKQILYKKAYTIESVENPKKIDDKLEGDANGKVVCSLLEDSSFGKNFYELSYLENETEIYTKVTNLDSMGVGFVKAIQPRQLALNVIVVDCVEDFVIYLSADTECSKFPGIEKTMESSLVSRLDAIYDWVISELKNKNSEEENES